MNISLDSNGTYRWIYELNLYKNYDILFLIWKIFGYIFWGLWLFMLVLDFFDDNLSFANAFEITLNLSIFALFFMFLCAIGYFIYAFIMNGKYCVLFEMDDKGINHIQMQKQVERAEAISTLTMLAGALTGRPSMVGAGMLTNAHTSLYSAFKDIKSVESFPNKNLIKLNETFVKNQIYVEKEDYDFVLNFIYAHVERRLKK